MAVQVRQLAPPAHVRGLVEHRDHRHRQPAARWRLAKSSAASHDRHRQPGHQRPRDPLPSLREAVQRLLGRLRHGTARVELVDLRRQPLRSAATAIGVVTQPIAALFDHERADRQCGAEHAAALLIRRVDLPPAAQPPTAGSRALRSTRTGSSSVGRSATDTPASATASRTPPRAAVCANEILPGRCRRTRPSARAGRAPASANTSASSTRGPLAAHIAQRIPPPAPALARDPLRIKHPHPPELAARVAGRVDHIALVRGDKHRARALP